MDRKTTVIFENKIWKVKVIGWSFLCAQADFYVQCGMKCKFSKKLLGIGFQKALPSKYIKNFR